MYAASVLQDNLAPGLFAKPSGFFSIPNIFIQNCFIHPLRHTDRRCRIFTENQIGISDEMHKKNKYIYRFLSSIFDRATTRSSFHIMEMEFGQKETKEQSKTR